MVESDGAAERKPASDCARMHGFVGLICRSNRGLADNLILFNWDDDKIFADGEPWVIEVAPWKHPKGYRDPLGFWMPDDIDGEPEASWEHF